LTVRAGLARLPIGTTWRQVAGVAALGGIGFTVSLFIAELAFSGTPVLDRAKTGVLVASLVAGIAGGLLLRGTGRVHGSAGDSPVPSGSPPR
jgi:NhaA family Na+:H+ antiporter